jgi:DNA-binding NarL/FixJ family response regulator
MQIRVSIADDHPLIINGLKQILESCDDISIIATYSDGADLLNGLTTTQPDVLLLDIHMPKASGEEVAPEISRKYNAIKIIALTNQDNVYYLKTMMQYGAAGYVLKTSGADMIIEAIRAVHSGQTFIDPVLKEKLVEDALSAKRQTSAPQLTRREKEVLELIASNFSSKEIAEQLFLSKRTIDNHRLSLLLKLEVKNSAALIRKAMQMGLINISG